MRRFSVLAIVLGALAYSVGLSTPTAAAGGSCYTNWTQAGVGCAGCSNGECGDCIQASPNTCGGPGTIWICNKQQDADLEETGDYGISVEMPCKFEIYCTADNVWPCAGNKCVAGQGTGNYSSTKFYQLQPQMPRGGCGTR